MLRVLLTLAMLSSAALMPAQAPASSAAQGEPIVLEGRVVTGEPPEPLRRVRVAPDGAPSDPVFTDDEGRFAMMLPAAGTHRIVATKAGFAPQAVTRTGETPAEPLTMAMVRGAVVTGRLVDQFGDPLAGQIHLRLVEPPDAPPGAVERSTDADDLGEFRIGSLPAGLYEVAIVPSSRSGPASARVALRDQPAATVELRAGEQVRLADFAYELGTTRVMSSGTMGGSPELQRGTGIIAGRVTRSDGRPAAGAHVLAVAPTGATRGMSADTDGRYEISTLPPGEYRLRAQQEGFEDAEYDGRVILRDGERLERVNLTIRRPDGPRRPVIAGTVLDEYGEPLEGIHIHAWRLTYISGRMQAVRAGVPSRQTDDRGQYLLHSVSPGTYYVVASDSSPAASDAADAVFYPGRASAADAQPVRVDAGLDAWGVDITLVPVPAARVTGVVQDASGRPVRAMVSLTLSERSRAVALPLQSTLADDAGAFTFNRVRPGDYLLQARTMLLPDRTGRPAPLPEFGMQYVTVHGGDAIPPLTVTTAPGSTVIGRIVLEDDGTAIEPSAVRLAATAVAADMAVPGAVTIHDDWTFEATGLFGPTRIALAAAPEGWWLRSITIDGVDAADDPVAFGPRDQPREGVVAVLSNAGADVQGQAVDERRAPVTDFFVVVFPTDATRWFPRSRYLHVERGRADGSFAVGALPPGHYYVAAVTGSRAAAEWRNPEVLGTLVSAARQVRLGERERVSLELRRIHVP